MSFLVGLFFALVGSIPTSLAEDWPAWRGVLGDGTVNDSKAPVKWRLAENLVWKVPVPGKGHASPIILGDRVYLVTAMGEEQTRDLICLDRATGKKLWSKVELRSPFEGVHRLNSRASSTPSSDGERI